VATARGCRARSLPDEQQVVAAETHWRDALPSAGWWQEHLTAHGFDVPHSGVLDAETSRALAVFQMRYRPARYDGEPDSETAALLEVITSPGACGFVAAMARGRSFAPSNGPRSPSLR